MIGGGFGRIGDVFRGLGGFGELVFERHMFTKTMVIRGVCERISKTG
jgi:hypothetical protein